MELSFGEQIKILLKRKNMTIKDLADLYTTRTGTPMSRQNLTQRLKRDNFPEQDMHIIAALLGYNVSIQLTPAAVTLPEFVRMEAAAPIPPQMGLESPVPVVPTAVDSAGATAQTSAGGPGTATQTSTDTPATTAQTSTDTPAATAQGTAADAANSVLPPAAEEGPGITFQIPEAFRKNKPQGDINPLTGQEYLTNTVRRHPDIEEYVQVYDQTTHSWSDVREDYFWEFQEKKKQMMGADYQAPIQI